MSRINFMTKALKVIEAGMGAKVKSASRQSCKKCGVRSGIDFHVPDALWVAIVPKRFSCKPLCLDCFDKFAAQRGIEYHRSLRVLYFAGSQASFKIRVVNCARARPL